MSAYQILALAGAGYGLGIVAVLRGSSSYVPDLSLGLEVLMRPGVMLSLQVIWIVIFLYTGRSKVTVSRLAVAIDRDQI